MDDEDYPVLMVHKWHADICNGKWYARGRHNGPIAKMHRIILDAPKGVDVDHIDGDGLNNRRSNLRLCTEQQNCQNRRKQDRQKAPYKGMTRDSRRSSAKWVATIQVNGKQVVLGRFISAEDAARAYDAAAKKYFGEFAKLNFP